MTQPSLGRLGFVDFYPRVGGGAAPRSNLLRDIAPGLTKDDVLTVKLQE